jgi:hypothetical protein
MLLFCTDGPICGRVRQEDEGPSTPSTQKKKTPAKKKLKKAAAT